ncbi:MAG: hypothetical protein JNK64_10340 [Myxococcales bacterium]|nr:hypothetical protein [Myxococcales bacterium]
MIRAALIGLAVAALTLGAAIALRAERLLGPPDAAIDLAATVPGDASLAACERAWRARLRGYAIQLRVVSARDATTVVAVAVRGAPAREAEGLAAALARPGALAFQWVDNDAAVARAWFQRLDPAHAPARSDGVAAVADGWSDDGGAARQDYFLTGPSPAAITAALAEVAPDAPVPPGRALVFERVAPRPDAPAAPAYRSYLVEDAPILTQADVASARVAANQFDGRPEVELTWSDPGAQVFGDQTAARTGAKLAILVDGEVASAPVARGAIRGGRAMISMGGGDLLAAQRDAVALAHSLDGGGGLVPPGVTARVVGVRAGDASSPWLVRGGLAALAGIAAAAAALRLARRR